MNENYGYIDAIQNDILKENQPCQYFYLRILGLVYTWALIIAINLKIKCHIFSRNTLDMHKFHFFHLFFI